MTSSKHTKRALLASILSAALCAAMLVGSTFAWFTDSVTSGKNKIVAGSLDVELEYTTDFNTWNTVEDATNLFQENALWEPGYAEAVYLRVRNAGTLALKYQFGINIESEQGGVNAAGEEFLLSDYLKYGVAAGQTSVFANRADAIGAVEDSASPLSGYTANGNLTAGSEDTLALVVYMPESVGNEANYRGEQIPTIELGISVVATQDTVEEDGFGSDYDADAVYPELPDRIDTVITGTVTDGNETVLTDAASGVTATIPANAASAGTVNLSVTTEQVTTDSVTYDISLTDEEGKTVLLSEKMTVTINIGGNLKNVTVKHNGTPMDSADYSYNATTGILSISTASFSPFEVSYERTVVARIGNTGYSTVNAAITAAKDGDTVVVTEDITTPNIILNLLTKKAVTIDLNGKILTYTGTSRGVQLAYGAEMTILNGTILMPNSADSSRGIFVYGTDNTGTLPCKLTMKNVNVESAFCGIFSQGANNTITVENCNIASDAYCALYQNGSSSPVNITLTDSVLSSDATTVYVSNSSAAGRAKQELSVSGCTIKGKTALEIKHTNATIKDSDLIGTSTPTGSGENNNGACTDGYALAVTTNGANDYVTGTVTVSGCRFFNGDSVQETPNGYCFVYTVAEGSSVTIDGEAVSDYNSYGDLNA